MKLLGLLAGSALLMASVTGHAEEKATDAEAAKAQAAGMETMMLQMAKQQALKTCSNQEMLSCMEVAKSDCETMMNGVIDKCMAPNLGELMSAQNMSPEERKALNEKMENCANGISEEHGIDPAKAQSCSPKQQ
jgi:hypothetical protein